MDNVFVPEMVERLARVLAKMHGGDPDGGPNKARPIWMLYEVVAIAVIEAMREPTDAMLNRGGYHCITGAGAVSKGDLAQAKAVWKAMIDAALPTKT